MSRFQITTDSTVDLPRERLHALGVPFVPMHFSIAGVSYEDDRTPQTTGHLFKRMREGCKAVTSQITVEGFLNMFGRCLGQGLDILHISFPGALSGTINSAQVARNQLLEQFPDRKIIIIDCLTASVGEGLLLEYALGMQKNGAALEECASAVEVYRLKIWILLMVNDLAYLKRGGRISGTAALLGSLVSLKPILTVDAAGKLRVLEKAKGQRSAIKKMLAVMEETVDKQAPKAYVVYADNEPEAEKLQAQVAGMFPQIHAEMAPVGAVIGSHVGPGALALVYVGAPRMEK